MDVCDANPGGMSLREVGEIFGVTRERIRQIQAMAMGQLAAELAQRGIITVLE